MEAAGQRSVSLNANLDPFNLRNNYGVQAGRPAAHLQRRLFRQSAESGARQQDCRRRCKWLAVLGHHAIQSGANLTGNSTNRNFNMQLNGAILPGTQNIVEPDGGTNGIPINNQSFSALTQCN